MWNCFYLWQFYLLLKLGSSCSSTTKTVSSMAEYQPVHLAYNTYEPDSGTDESLAPVIFIHGVGDYKEYWLDIPQNIANATKRRVYTYDARNHGDSEWSDIFNFDIIGDDLLYLLEKKGTDKSILVGHSMGGVTAIKATLKQPDKVEKLVVIDMFVRKIPAPIFEVVISYFYLSRQAIEAAPEDLDEDGMKQFVLDYIQNHTSPDDQEKKDGFESVSNHVANFRRDENGRVVFRANMEVIENAMRNQETIMSENHGLYEGPALFIYGELSPFQVGADAEHIRTFFPNATFQGIEGATHTVHADKPVEFTDALLNFLA